MGNKKILRFCLLHNSYFSMNRNTFRKIISKNFPSQDSKQKTISKSV